MNYTLLIGLAIFGAMMFSSIQITRRAMLSLTPEEKVRLVNASTARRGYGIFIVVNDFMNVRYSSIFSSLPVLLILGIIAIVLAQKRLARVNISRKFQARHGFGFCFAIAGLLGFALSVLWHR